MADSGKKKSGNDAVRFLANMQSSQRGLRNVALAALFVAAVVAVGASFLALDYVRKSEDNVYVLDQGAVLELRRATNGEQKDLEVIDHVTRFHELFYNISPNVTTINENTARALELADESAYRVFNDLKEQSHYANMIQRNASQQIIVDSVAVNVLTYPYQVTTFCTLYILRETKIFQYTMRTKCEVLEVQRSRKNPHGLMMTRYFAEDPELVKSVTR